MFCPCCGNQSTPQLTVCSCCGAGIVSNDLPDAESRIVRPENESMIAGVCSGIAIHFGWDIARVRKLFAVAACLTVGAVIPLYLAAWKLLPAASFALPPATRHINAPGSGRPTSAPALTLGYPFLSTQNWP
jgi:phage shock protein PspC (stress-responsive transcriptional regulator)